MPSLADYHITSAPCHVDSDQLLLIEPHRVGPPHLHPQLHPLFHLHAGPGLGLWAGLLQNQQLCLLPLSLGKCLHPARHQQRPSPGIVLLAGVLHCTAQRLIYI